MRTNSLQQQRGATLVVSLIMLVLLTLFALSAMNVSNTNLKIASNSQSRTQLAFAVQQELDKTMSVNFTINPASVAGNKPIDINNDGAIDYNVAIATPTCLSGARLRNTDLDPAIPADRPCFVGGGAPLSLCSNTIWDIQGSATDPLSGASVTIHQGVGVRVAVGSC